jgi:hypothetical protein
MIFQHTGMRPATPGTQRMLAIAALFNFFAAGVIVFLSRIAPQMIGLEAPSASQQMFVDLTAASVFCFGLGYGLGGRNLPIFWPFVALGILGKSAFVLIVAVNFFAGATGWLPLALVMCDAAFAVLFFQALNAHSLGAKVHE